MVNIYRKPPEEEERPSFLVPIIGFFGLIVVAFAVKTLLVSPEAGGGINAFIEKFRATSTSADKIELSEPDISIFSDKEFRRLKEIPVDVVDVNDVKKGNQEPFMKKK